MTVAGWILMIASWSAIFFWTGWCFHRVLTSTRHWANPEEDIAHLLHGFSEPPPPENGEPRQAAPFTVPPPGAR